MQGLIDGFTYGIVTPIASYAMSYMGSILGLRCTVRSLNAKGAQKALWLGLGAACIGTGIWTMHFIAMVGFSVKGTVITYDTDRTLISLIVAVAVVGFGVFLVGYRGVTFPTLVGAGTATGLGVAGMHYIGMSSMHLKGRLLYDTTTVVASVAIAVGAAIAALWAAVSIHGLKASLLASVIMGMAVTGMHYTGMAAVSVHLHSASTKWVSSTDPLTFMIRMLEFPVGFLFLATFVVVLDPQLLLGEHPRESGRG
ncbi:MHYT domain-containing protein [Streptomyces sp. NPDC002306]